MLEAVPASSATDELLLDRVQAHAGVLVEQHVDVVERERPDVGLVQRVQRSARRRRALARRSGEGRRPGRAARSATDSRRSPRDSTRRTQYAGQAPLSAGCSPSARPDGGAWPTAAAGCGRRSAAARGWRGWARGRRCGAGTRGPHAGSSAAPPPDEGRAWRRGSPSRTLERLERVERLGAKGGPGGQLVGHQGLLEVGRRGPARGQRRTRGAPKRTGSTTHGRHPKHVTQAI